MPRLQMSTSNISSRRLYFLVTIVTMQALAATYFFIDGFNDLIALTDQESWLAVFMDWVVAVALVAGIYFGAQYVRHLWREIAQKDATLLVARGAMADHAEKRFSEWGLTAGEADVALFAMKGCSIAEIAEMRGAAAGTVRAQLSQIYAKAGVSSQSMLVSLFIEDLLGTDRSD